MKLRKSKKYQPGEQKTGHVSEEDLDTNKNTHRDLPEKNPDILNESKKEPIDESGSDGSANAFEGTEEVKDE